ncbi:MAG: hypothetical protein AAB268_00025 [Elusimicrobiota bacterium]
MVRAAPRDIVRGIQIHLKNLKSLGELPQFPTDSAIKTEPQQGITQLPVSFLQQAYMGGDYVFNKAGASRYIPYVFQLKASIENDYVQRDGLRKLVFRRKPS